MANEIKIQATTRNAKGSGEARRVRRTGRIPAALTLLSRSTETLQIDAHDFMMVTRGQSSEQVLVLLDVEGRPVNALLREIQRDVITGNPIHVDFGEVDMTKKMRVSVTIKLVGEAEGVRTEGGVMTQMSHDVVIECLPADFVESFSVDVSAMKLGSSLTVADLTLGDRYTVITRGDVAVAAVIAPAAEEVVAAEEVAVGAAAVAAEGAVSADGKPAAAPAAGADAAKGAPAKGAAPSKGAAPAKKA